MRVGKQAAPEGAGCVIYHFDVRPDFTSSGSQREHNLFDELVSELEADPAQELDVREARKWVADQFYPKEEKTIAHLRLVAGLSQQELGDACGLAQPHVSRYESGRHAPSIDVAYAMSRALNIDLDTFYEAWERTAKHARANAKVK